MGAGCVSEEAADAIRSCLSVVMNDFVKTSWFALADLGCALIGGLVLIASPEPSWPPLVIALLPWVGRLAMRRFPFQRTALDLFIALFVFTAVVGVWAAYDPALAWSKFWLLLGAIFIFYALAGQPRENLWLVVGGFGGFGALLAGFFLLTNDWNTHPADLGFVNRIALQWMSIRPPLGASDLDAHVADGLLAMFIPLIVAVGLRAWSEGRKALVAIAIAVGAVALLGWFLGAHRGAWLSLVVALGLWAAWLIGERAGRRTLFVGAVAALLGIAVLFALAFPALAIKIIAPGSRLEVWSNTLKLITDFPIAGGGLNSFAGLYSRYLLVIPWLFLPYSYSLFLDMALEQGLLGLVALLGVLIGSCWQLVRTPSETRSDSYLRWGSLSGLIVMMAYSAVEDPFYYGWGTLFLFVVAGLAMAVTRPEADVVERWSVNWMLIGAVVTGMAATALFFYGPLLSAWHANMGAVSMAKVELLDWPNTARWQSALDLSEFDPAIASFIQAKQMSSDNFTATYRLGLIAAKRGDNEAAIKYWEQAQKIDPDHRGLRKELGYYYVWAGQVDRAVPLLNNITEAKDEMNTYSWWWGTQGRDDLAAHAAQMARLLAGQ